MKNYNLFYFIASFNDWRVETLAETMKYLDFKKYYQVFPNCYIILTSEDITADDIFKYLDRNVFSKYKLLTNTEDTFMVMEMSTDVQGWLPNETWNDIRNLIGNQFSR